MPEPRKTLSVASIKQPVATHVSPNVTVFPCQCAHRDPLVISGQRHDALNLTISTSTQHTPDESTHAHLEFSGAQLRALRGRERYLKELVLAHKHDVIVRLRIKLGCRVDRPDRVPTRVEPSNTPSAIPSTQKTRRPH